MEPPPLLKVETLEPDFGDLPDTLTDEPEPPLEDDDDEPEPLLLDEPPRDPPPDLAPPPPPPLAPPPLRGKMRRGEGLVIPGT